MWYDFTTRNTASLLRNNRFRRDQRMLEEEEETWFDQEDEVDDGENIMPMSDVLKSKLDSDLDQLGRLFENRRGLYHLKSLPNIIILDLTELATFAVEKINMTETIKSGLLKLCIVCVNGLSMEQCLLSSVREEQNLRMVYYERI